MHFEKLLSRGLDEWWKVSSETDQRACHCNANEIDTGCHRRLFASIGFDAMGEQPAEPDLPLQFHFSSVFQDQLLLDTTRSRGIAVELHGELSFALGC